MASTPTSSPAFDPALSQDISPTAYITMFSVGSIVLIFLITIACYSVLRTRHLSDREAQLFAAKRGLDDGIIGGYPRIMFSQLKNAQLRGDSSSASCTDTFCSICLCDYVEADMVLLLPDCGHFFHVRCVGQWLKVRLTCPICRNTPAPASIPPDGQELRRG